MIAFCIDDLRRQYNFYSFNCTIDSTSINTPTKRRFDAESSPVQAIAAVAVTAQFQHS